MYITGPEPSISRTKGRLKDITRSTGDHLRRVLRSSLASLRFTPMDRMNDALKLATLFVAAVAVLTAAEEGAFGQAPGSSAVGGDIATPVEITMNTVNSDVQCGPPRARLPARDPLDLRVMNRSEFPIMFVAPEFFKASQHIESAGFAMDLVKGGFLVAPKSTVRVLLRTPAPGEYYFSCFHPNSIPNPASSGFLIVVPAAT
ncbi:hypothetical protein ILT44_24100 [Microvirga sp. BT689]|uniref:hypothetical protein n=1 Tax=Microvirga arvi TaxID=2778731 RepID=UPI00194DB3BF|nr:hypothetical protein [Microvirga arvi]MBM6583288.1 hypothetical protein [Microvirga arvi]